MIIKASSIPHGQAMTNYTTKNNRADMVKVNQLSDGLPPMGMWDEMALHLNRFKKKFERKPIKRTSIRIESSPSREECKNWTMEDWQRYEQEVIAEIDKVDCVTNAKGEPIKVVPTNLSNSQYFAALHRDSDSGIPHLHWVVNRVDRDGNINDCHYIGQRAVIAAHHINLRHGWIDPQEIHEEHAAQIAQHCEDILRHMPYYSLGEYFDQLRDKGYKVVPKRDKQGVIRNYQVFMGNSKFIASELGKSKKFTVAHLETTYYKFKAEEQGKQKLKPTAMQTQTSFSGRTQNSPSVEGSYGTSQSGGTSSQGNSVLSSLGSEHMSSMFTDILTIDDSRYKIAVSQDGYDELTKALEIPTDGFDTMENVLNVGLLLMMEYFDAATSMAESCGGGGSVSGGWGRDKDEDDREWARRCAAQAKWFVKPARIRSRSR